MVWETERDTESGGDLREQRPGHLVLFIAGGVVVLHSCSTNVETCMLREDGREVRVWIQSASTCRAYEYSWGKYPRLCIFNELISILQILWLFSHSSGQLYTLSGSRRSPRLRSQCMSSLGSMWIEDCTRYAV
jgi:hypothetical protein